MREAQTKKIPYTIILGDKERDENLISYRLHGSNETNTMNKDEFIKVNRSDFKQPSEDIPDFIYKNLNLC